MKEIVTRNNYCVICWEKHVSRLKRVGLMKTTLVDDIELQYFDRMIMFQLWLHNTDRYNELMERKHVYRTGEIFR
jgi:hypothetical protein